MSIYRVNPVSGSRGFKVQVADTGERLRVVGIFLSEADANEWIAVDSRMAEATSDDNSHPCTRQE
jgi:hypothetical protein